MSCAAVDLSVLLDRIERPKSRITGSRENHIRAFTDLRQGQFFSLAGIVPGRISYAYVVLYDLDIRINRLRAFFVPFFKPMNQGNVHASYKAKHVRLRGFGGNDANEI